MPQLGESVHREGYEVVQTGEGAAETLAGYVRFRTERTGNHVARWCGRFSPRLLHRAALRSSVEPRYPVLDEDVVGFCAELDGREAGLRMSGSATNQRDSARPPAGQSELE